jgi:hypothetical protein
LHADPHVVEGTWDGISHLKPKNKTYGDVKGQAFYHVPGKDEGGEKKTSVTAVGGESDGSMGDFETRKLWGIVAKGIKTGDFELASREKIKIEVRFQFLVHQVNGTIIYRISVRTSKGRGERTKLQEGKLGP